MLIPPLHSAFLSNRKQSFLFDKKAATHRVTAFKSNSLFTFHILEFCLIKVISCIVLCDVCKRCSVIVSIQ